LPTEISRKTREAIQVEPITKVLIPINYVKHKLLINCSQEITPYSAKGREFIGYQKLMLEYYIRDIFTNSDKRLSTELVDNSISRISAQKGYCFISKIFTFDGMIYHIIPINRNVTHEYKNIIYVEKAVYNVLSADTFLEIKEYWEEIKAKSGVENDILIRKINYYRHKAGRNPIIFA
jgi:hypothetical protein